MNSAELSFEINPAHLPTAVEVLSLLESAGTSFPIWTSDRMERALKQSSLVICIRHEQKLIGFARVLTDFAWMGYLNQLAIAPDYQKQGLGTKLLTLIKKEIGPEVSLLLHSAPDAHHFYQKHGFEIYHDVYRLKREH